MVTVLVVLLVTFAAWLLVLPGRRPELLPGRQVAPRRGEQDASPWRGAGEMAGRAAAGGTAAPHPVRTPSAPHPGSTPSASTARGRTPTRRRGRARGSDAGELPLGAALVEVAARLRTGADVPSAWRATLATRPGAPSSLAELARRTRAGPRGDAVAGAQVAVAVADRLGAPVADVLECCAQGLAEAEEGASQRRTALAAPRATARLLAWLPLAGLGLGVLLGVDPVAVFVDGGAGSACLLLGLVLMFIGRRWSAALVRQAERTDD